MRSTGLRAHKTKNLLTSGQWRYSMDHSILIHESLLETFSIFPFMTPSHFLLLEGRWPTPVDHNTMFQVALPFLQVQFLHLKRWATQWFIHSSFREVSLFIVDQFFQTIPKRIVSCWSFEWTLLVRQIFKFKNYWAFDSSSLHYPNSLSFIICAAD